MDKISKNKKRDTQTKMQISGSNPPNKQKIAGDFGFV